MSQFVQKDYDKIFTNDLTYANNKFHSFIFSKQHFRSYRRPNNATVPLFHFLRFLNRLCPRKHEHMVYYCMSQLQPFETIICGELCILVAEILYRDLKVQHTAQATIPLLKTVSARIQYLFSSATTSRAFVTLVKQHMLTIDSS